MNRVRERVEDLGRILVVLEKSHEFFDLLDRSHLKLDNFIDYYSNEDSEKNEERLCELYTYIRNMENIVSECILIARGHDDLNSTREFDV